MFDVPAVENPIITRLNGHWKFPEKMDPFANTGFVYVIRDNVLERFYLGKKFFKTTRQNRPVESDWKRYKGSSRTMDLLFDNRPIDEFEFIVLEQYKFRGAVSYAETWTLCLVEAPTTNVWYNTRIEEVTWTVKEKVSVRHKERLEKVIRIEAFNK